jgi:hypothetical protein
VRLIDANALYQKFSVIALKARQWKEGAILNGNEEAAIRADAVLAFLVEVKAAIEDAPTVEAEWDNHKVACLLADMFGDTCACNYNGIDGWLPKKCDFANSECPNVAGVACWEQFLKYKNINL